MTLNVGDEVAYEAQDRIEADYGIVVSRMGASVEIHWIIADVSLREDEENPQIVPRSLRESMIRLGIVYYGRNPRRFADSVRQRK